MGERTLDALAGIVFIITILGLRYLNIDIGFGYTFLWIFATLFHAFIFGKHAFPKSQTIVSAPMGLFLLFAVQSMVQVIWYYSGGPLGPLSDAWSLTIAMAAAHLTSLGIAGLQYIKPPPPTPEVPKNETWQNIVAIILVGVSVGSLIFIAFGAWQAQTMDSIRTPWPLIPTGTLVAIAFLWIATALSAGYVRNAILTGLHAGLAMAGTLILAPLIYRLGFGFDGFLHIAGETVLRDTGFLEPKPVYYMGQYVFTTWISRLSGISLTLLNHWLVPLMASILLPLSTSIAYRNFHPRAGVAVLLALFPLGFFVAGTPQGLSLILGLVSLILAIGTTRRSVGIAAWFWLGLWSISVHPLAGLPLMVLGGALIVGSLRSRKINWMSWPLSVAAGFAIPFAFYILSTWQKIDIQWSIEILKNSGAWLSGLSVFIPWLGNKYVLWPAWASIVGLSLPLIGLGLAGVSIWRETHERKNTILLLLGGLSLILCASLMQSASEFTFLIQYERGDYSARMIAVATYILLIAGIPAVSALFDRFQKLMPAVTLILVILVGAIGSANAYNALPRHDAAQASRGWSTGRADIEAVRWIDRYAKNQPYTVLANQSVSAAAVKELGFKRYTKDGIFFYPIPTGGELYDVFLKMTYEFPTRDTAEDAARLGESNLIFVVINDYWWRAEILNQQIAEIADDNWTVEDGRVNVFVFKNLR